MLFGFRLNLLNISTSCAEAFNQNNPKNINKINAKIWAASRHYIVFVMVDNVKLQIKKINGLHQMTEQLLEI